MWDAIIQIGSTIVANVASGSGQDCRSEAQMAGEVGGAPCPGQIPEELVAAAIANAPESARQQLLSAFRANNPWWCGPGLPSAFAIAKAAAGGGDCRMSRDRGNLVATLQAFVAQYGTTGALPPWSLPPGGGGSNPGTPTYGPDPAAAARAVGGAWVAIMAVVVLLVVWARR